MAVAADLEILVVEDNPADALRVREALASGAGGRFHPSFAGGLKEAEGRLDGADLVLLDLSLPDSAGAETVARVRRIDATVPIIVLSGERDGETTFRCLQHGALDVLLKGAMDGDALVRAITCALERRALAEERDRALPRARGAEADLREVLDTVGEGIVIADPRGRVLLVNPAAERLLGWTPGEAVGRALDVPVEVGKVLDSGRVGPGGQPAVLEARSAAIRWEGAPATLTLLREVEQRRRREGRRPGRGSGTAEERAESELRETIRRLATGISRGLGEPLASVLEGANELSDGPDAAAYGPALKIQRAAWQASGLVRMLQASAGEAKSIAEPLDLGEVVASQWDRVEENRTDALVFTRDLAPDLPRVLADRRLVAQALLCLVDHARNSVARGGEVSVRTARHGRTRVALAVSDTGPWLGPGACRRIFEPFYSTDVLGIGTGLGLAPVLGIALQCGGTADVRSIPGLGTTVRILLPVMDEAPPAPAA